MTLKNATIVIETRILTDCGGIMNNITLSDIKKNNTALIYQLLYQKGKLSKQELASQLHLSLPTVTQNLVSLEEDGLIMKEGLFKSQVGRKAVAYTICPTARIGIGVEIQKKKIQILSLDLKGTICHWTEHSLNYENNDLYYKETAYLVKDFILEHGYNTEKILGIGFAVQGLTSTDGTEIIYGKTLGYTGLNIKAFSQHLNFPCSFLHDAKCAAGTELWFGNTMSHAIYLSIGKHLGSALIMNGQIVMGKTGHCGAAEHIQLIPNGRKCYCGKTGCMETYCSMDALLNEDENQEAFFQALRNHSKDELHRWEAFMEMLSSAINSLHTLLDCDIIIGGQISSYLTEEDIRTLQTLCNEKSAFPDNEPFVFQSKYLEHTVPVGAVLPYIQGFLEQFNSFTRLEG